MSFYSEKPITFHAVMEYDQDFEHRWFEARVDGYEIGCGPTLEECIKYCQEYIELPKEWE